MTEAGATEALPIAIIGTAGRRDDAARLDADVYRAMVAVARWTVGQHRGARPVRLVSGGAAWADHVAVSLFLEGEGEGDALTLHLPAAFTGYRYAEGGGRFDPGRTSNHYHQAFSDAIGRDSWAEIALAIERGAEAAVTPGFKRRNLKVADAVDGGLLLAFTFGSASKPASFSRGSLGFDDPLSAGLKDGGTAHTYGQARGALRKIHLPVQSVVRMAQAIERRRAGQAAGAVGPGVDQLLPNPAGDPGGDAAEDADGDAAADQEAGLGAPRKAPSR